MLLHNIFSKWATLKCVYNKNFVGTVGTHLLVRYKKTVKFSSFQKIFQRYFKILVKWDNTLLNTFK